MNLKIKDFRVNRFESFYVFEMKPSDGTCYTVQFLSAEYGGIYVIVNESSCWRWHGGKDIKFLMGKENDYTKKAVIEIMNYHIERWSLDV